MQRQLRHKCISAKRNEDAFYSIRIQVEHNSREKDMANGHERWVARPCVCTVRYTCSIYRTSCDATSST